MKKIWLAVGLSAASGCMTFGAHAALLGNSTLSIGAGSSFAFVDFPGDVQTIGVEGIVLGTVQPYDYSAEAVFVEGIDYFEFLFVQGMHYTTSPITILNATGSSATLDFSGWSWSFNNAAAAFNLGSGAWGGNADGVAQVTCAVDCGNGDTYTLYYSAAVPTDEPNGYAGFLYELNFTGTISAVPVPPAIWLLGSGLLGLIGIAKKKRT